MSESRVQLRVCIVAPLPPPFGGIGRWVTTVLRYWTDQDEISIRTVDTSPRWRKIDNLSVWRRVLGGGAQLVRDLVLFVWQLCSCRPDIVHLTTSGRLAVWRDLAILLVARLWRVPCVYHLHCGRVPSIAQAGALEWSLMSRAIRWAATVVPIDAATENTIASCLPGATLRRLPNCLAADEFPAWNRHRVEEPAAVFIGWILPAKGIADLLEAWEEAARDGWRLQIIGPVSPVYRSQLLKRYRSADVEFAGEMNHEEAMLALSSAGAFVFPSHTEGFPYAVLEAMAMGKAIVATAVGAIPEMLHDGCGVLVPPKDPAALATALSAVLANADLRRSLGDRASRRARREYSVDIVLGELKTLWFDLSR